MALSPRIGVIQIPVDGQWDIEDLLSLSEALSETYGLFYPIVCTDEVVAARLHDLLRKQFWAGDIDMRRFGRHVYHQIPKEESLKLKSFQYNSPGIIEIAGVFSVLLMASRVARSWIQTGDAFIALWEKIDKFFQKRKQFRKPKQTTKVDAELAEGSDEALTLVFEVGGNLGFDALSCQRLVEIVGNPISTLKYLVAVGNEGRKLAKLESEGLVRLPSASDDTVLIPRPKTRAREAGVEVVHKRRRKRKQP
jgi:hypothetical protein